MIPAQAARFADRGQAGLEAFLGTSIQFPALSMASIPCAAGPLRSEMHADQGGTMIEMQVKTYRVRIALLVGIALTEQRTQILENGTQSFRLLKRTQSPGDNCILLTCVQL